MADAASLAVVVLQGSILVTLVVAVRRRNVAAAVNALGALVLALLPTLAERILVAVLFRDVAFGPLLPVWLAAAGFLHSLGMLGPYESTGWWDHLTHTVSAALVAALIYAVVLVAGPVAAGIGRSPAAIAVVTVVYTFVVGVFWELIELVAREVGERYDIEPVLVHYGWRDTALDLVFDVVGALLVVGADLRAFVPLVEQFPGAAGPILLGSGWVILAGSLAMALFLGVSRYDLDRLLSR